MRTMSEKLKIGLLVESMEIPNWVYHMLERIKRENYAEISLIIRRNSPESSKPKGSKLSRIWQKRSLIGYVLHRKLEEKLFKVSPDAFEFKNLEEIVDCPTLDVQVRETKYSDYVLDEYIQQIREHKLDLMIRLGFKILRGDILTSAKHGIWSYHHADSEMVRGGPTGTYEIMRKMDHYGVTLQILTEEMDDGKILARSYSSTDKLSIKRNVNNNYWKSLSLIPRRIKDLSVLGPEKFYETVEDTEVTLYSNRLIKMPNNRQMIRGFLPIYLDVIWRRFKRFFVFDQWILLYYFGKNSGRRLSFYRFKRLLPPKNSFWADPFVVKENGKFYAFFEIYLNSRGLGHLAVFELGKKGPVTEPIDILKTDYHLSYPFVFKEDDKWYMIPETKQVKRIELYECEEFPHKWKKVGNMMENIQAVDATILKKDGLYWMFTNVVENQGGSSHDELFLYYSETLYPGDWKPHPQNPLVSDVRNARPAGKIFTHNGKTYRPAQDCAKAYGYAININEIVELTTTSYKEVRDQSILPNWAKDLKGVHTINFCDELTIIDANISRKKF